MKLPPLRTWLIVAAGVLLLAGAVVFYVVKNPSLPPGWEWYEDRNCRVALPPGDRLPAFSDPKVTVMLGEGLSVGVRSTDLSVLEEPGPPDVELDRYIESELISSRGERLVSCEAIRCNGYPARVVSTMADGRPRKRLVVVAREWRHVAFCDLVPDVFTEKDADFLFRSFRPK